MHVAHENLRGLDRDRLMSVVEPVLRAHSVEPVELVWRSDQRGRLLELTVEKPGAVEPGEGVTLELCTEISRDLASALDVADFMPEGYRLEVGSPGLERALYEPADYERFRGKTAKLKLTEPVEGQFAVRAVLRGLSEDGRVVVDTDWGERTLDPAKISSARLVFEWGPRSKNGGNKHGRRRRSM